MSRIRPVDVDAFDDDLDDFSDGRAARRRRPSAPPRRRADPPIADIDHGPPDGARLSTYQDSRAAQGPRPAPDWLITSATAVDHELGTIKSGKEADVDLLERVDPATGRRHHLAAKRYRSAEHRLFHRDAGYLEGRRIKDSREMRAMATRTDFGKQVIAVEWARAEFKALAALWSAGISVPYPTQYNGTELLLEFIGTADGRPAPRLAEIDADRGRLLDLFEQCRTALLGLAANGWAHGDLSPYNLLVDGDRIVLIDLPQVVDVIVNPHGPAFLERDCRNLGDWFDRRGLAVDADDLVEELLGAAGR